MALLLGQKIDDGSPHPNRDLVDSKSDTVRGLIRRSVSARTSRHRGSRMEILVFIFSNIPATWQTIPPWSEHPGQGVNGFALMCGRPVAGREEGPCRAMTVST